jgi:hypothetical protein
MENKRDPYHHLDQFIAKRLPSFFPGVFETPNDPPSFAQDLRYLPLHDPTYAPSAF